MRPTPAPTPFPVLVPYRPAPAFSPLALALMAAGFVLLLTLAPLLTRALCRALGRERSNFRGDIIPASVGLTFLIVAAVTYVGIALTPASLAAPAPLFLFVAVGFGLLGLMDDLWGDRTIGGFRGHLAALARGKVTTGAVKLIGGGLISLGASFLIHGFHSPLRFVLDAALIALSANTLNLLDVRPGRAQFGFFLLCLPPLGAIAIAGFAWSWLYPPPAVLIGPVILAAAVEWWPDCRGRAMMGDTGSNLLGAVAGLSAALILPLSGHFFLFAVLLALNWLAEKVSLSRLISDTPWLAALDRQLGVR